MSENIKELVKRLRAWSRDVIGADATFADAADALEAMAGEVVLLREAMMEIDPHLDEDTEAVQRFRKALEATK